jgi:hypothetical protein
MDDDGKIGCSQSTGQRAWSFLPDALAARHTEALPTSRCRAVSGTWQSAAAEFVAL